MLVKDHDRTVAMIDVDIDPAFALATAECDRAVKELDKLKAQIKMLEDNADKMREIIIKALEDKDTLVGLNGTIIATYKAQEGRVGIDKNLLQERYPDAYKGCLVKGKAIRSLLLK